MPKCKVVELKPEDPVLYRCCPVCFAILPQLYVDTAYHNYPCPGCGKTHINDWIPIDVT